MFHSHVSWARNHLPFSVSQLKHMIPQHVVKNTTINQKWFFLPTGGMSACCMRVVSPPPSIMAGCLVLAIPQCCMSEFQTRQRGGKETDCPGFPPLSQSSHLQSETGQRLNQRGDHSVSVIPSCVVSNFDSPPQSGTVCFPPPKQNWLSGFPSLPHSHLHWMIFPSCASWKQGVGGTSWVTILCRSFHHVLCPSLVPPHNHKLPVQELVVTVLPLISHSHGVVVPSWLCLHVA